MLMCLYKVTEARAFQNHVLCVCIGHIITLFVLMLGIGKIQIIINSTTELPKTGWYTGCMCIAFYLLQDKCKQIHTTSFTPRENLK